MLEMHDDFEGFPKDNIMAPLSVGFYTPNFKARMDFR